MGAGPWQRIAAPVRVDPTGGYGPGGTACPGYSSPTVAFGTDVVMLAGTALPNGKCEVRFGAGRGDAK
jgi:hypothetical protein